MCKLLFFYRVCLAQCYFFRITVKLMQFDFYLLSILIFVKVGVMFVILFIFYYQSINQLYF